MTATTVRLLAALGVLAAAVGWGFSKVWETVVGRYLPVPWTAAAALALLAAALLIWALMVRPRLRREPGARPLEPLVAARTAALAMAASRTGAVAGGVHLGIAISFVPLWSIDAGRERVLAAGAAVVASLALVVIALWLERMCRLPDQLNDDDNVVRP
jgi:hypothetical protein